MKKFIINEGKVICFKRHWCKGYIYERRVNVTHIQIDVVVMEWRNESSFQIKNTLNRSNEG